MVTFHATKRAASLVAVFCSTFATSIAWSAPEAKDPKFEFERGVALFNAEEYMLAYDHLSAAYELSEHRPSTILALAQCERMLKRWDDALTHYREYLATGVSTEEQVRVNETIGVIETLKARAATEKAETPPAPELSPPSPPVASPKSASEPAPVLVVEPPPEEDGSILSSPWLWVAAGVAAVGGGVALAFALRSDPEPYKGNSGVFLQP